MDTLDFRSADELRAHYDRIRAKFFPQRLLMRDEIAPKAEPVEEPPRVVEAVKPLPRVDAPIERDRLVLVDAPCIGQPHLSVKDIAEETAWAFGVTVCAIFSRSRSKRAALARQVVCWIARAHTFMTLKEIGRRLSRDHATVLHAVRAIDERYAEDARLRKSIKLIERRLGIADEAEAA